MGKKQKSTARGGLRGLLYWVMIVVLWGGTAGALMVWNLPAFSDWQSARNQHEKAARRLELEEKAIERLEAEEKALAEDLDALERAAREEYLLLRPGEQVYVFSERRRPQY